MMYVYYDIDEDNWYLSKYKEQWPWYDKDGNEHYMDMEEPSDDMPVPTFIAERWVWGRMNVPDFEVYVMTGRYENVKGWVFVIKNDEDAMHYKLRWPIE